MQKVYMFTRDLGDGTSSVSFTKEPGRLDKLVDKDPEQYGMNEGYAKILTFPDDLDLAACGFSFDEDDDEDEDLDD